LGVRTNPLEHVRPEYSSEVLAQKARDLIRQIGYTDSFRDDAYGFGWDEEQIDHIRTNDVPEPRWDMVLAQSPAPLIFWYRRSPFALTALQFHQDLLTPGIVDPEDPPPILSGMAQAIMDHDGRLRFFEAIPPQRQDPAVPTSVLDWAPLLSAAGLDATKLQPAEPEWNWLSGPDVRMAWTGSWPESGRPLRVEAAAYRGRPVGFLLIAPWTTPRRAPAATPGRETVFVVVLFVLTVLMLAGAGVLARKNLREGRGDRRGAFRLACWMTLLLMALWVCQVHLVASVGLFAMFLVAIVTSVFYGVFAWTMYLALEPFVRRLWPQTLVSWTTLLNNGARDPVVGRDVLFGAAIGLVLAIFIRGMALWTGTDAMAYPGSTDVLLGIRGTLATVLMRLAYAIRSALFFFFLLFLFRALLRNRWAAAFAFAVLFAALNALSSTNPLTDSTTTLVYFGLVGFAVLRWGLLSLTVSVFVGDLFLNMPTTRDFSAWYSGNMLLLVGLVIVLAGWAFYTSVGRQLFRKDLFA
jgi:serine/threonine-protein kinase